MTRADYNDNVDPSREDRDDQKPLAEGIDYYLENGLFVFTAHFLLKRGYCCESGCRHCPYEQPSSEADS
jgi:hypothetical protein